MRSMFRASGPILAVAICSLAVGLTTHAQVDESADSEGVVLAEFEWGGEHHEITLGQLEREISELPEYRRDDYDGREGREEYLTLMAESRILLQRATDLGLGDEPEIDAKVEKYRLDNMMETIEEREVEDKLVITDQAIEEYFEANKEEKYGLPAQVRLTCVTLADQTEAADVLAQIIAGERTIVEVAKELSENRRNLGVGAGREGDSGLFSFDTYSEVEGLAEAAFALNVGETTPEVVQVDRLGRKYYMFFRLEEKNAPRIQTLEEVRRRVERSVEREKKKAREEEWDQQLREVARLVVHEDRIPEPPPQEEDDSSEETDAGAVPEDETAAVVEETDPALVVAEYTWGEDTREFTYGDLQEAFEALFVYRQSRYKTREDWIGLLNEALQDELRLREAEDLGIGATDENFQTYKEYRHQLMVEALVEREVDEQVTVEEDQVAAYYEEHKDEYLQDERVRLTALTFTSLEDAEKWHAEIKEGRDIGEAAVALSDMGKNAGPGGGSSGDTGLFQRSQYDSAEAFVDAAFSLEIGETTPEIIVQEMSNATYHILFRVEERVPPRTKELDEVRVRIEGAVKRVNKRARLEEWLADLKDRSELEVYPERLPDYPEEAAPEKDTESEG